MTIAIAAFTDNGLALQAKLTHCVAEKFIVFDKQQSSIHDWLNKEFYTCKAIIFIGATGIAIRLVAKLIVSKDKDPAIIAIDELGGFVIPLLSGHIGGANALAAKLAAAIGATPVITTATDLNDKFAVDLWATRYNCAIDNIDCIKNISAAILKGKSIAFDSDFSGTSALPSQLYQAKTAQIGISLTLNSKKKPFATTLKIMPRILTIGVGCRKNTPTKIFEQLMLDTLEAHQLSLKAVTQLASIDLKKDEECILAFTKKYKLDFITFSAQQLKTVAGHFNKSAFVETTTGVDNVCERAAVLSSQGNIILNKTVSTGITLAIAQQDWEYHF